MKKCFGCMRNLNDWEQICPSCGYSEEEIENNKKSFPESLPIGCVLSGRYIIGRVLSYSDFSMVYIAWDALLQQRVAVKEYFPFDYGYRKDDAKDISFASEKFRQSFEEGRYLFDQEAEELNRNQDLECIPAVYRCIHENNTSYIVMEYLEGITLEDYLEKEDKIPVQFADRMFQRILKELESLHKRKIFHWNISPDNIYLVENDKLYFMDFGKAKRKLYLLSDGKADIYKKGYQAPELIKMGKCDKKADIYSVGAIYYKLMTGEIPDVKKKKKCRGQKNLSSDKKKLLEAMLERVPQERAGEVTDFLCPM